LLILTGNLLCDITQLILVISRVFNPDPFLEEEDSGGCMMESEPTTQRSSRPTSTNQSLMALANLAGQINHPPV
jgi:hypothetical protein